MTATVLLVQQMSFAVEIAQPLTWPGRREYIGAVYKLIQRANEADAAEDAP